jgi:hypothetical protein
VTGTKASIAGTRQQDCSGCSLRPHEATASNLFRSDKDDQVTAFSMKTKRARKSGNDACSSTISIMEESPRKQHRRSVNPAVVQMRVPGVRSINAEGSEAPRLQTQDKRRLLNSPTFGQATQHGGVWMVSLFSTCCLPRSDGAAMANEARGAAIAPMVLLAVGCFWVSVGDGRSNTISLPAKFRAMLKSDMPAKYPRYA